MIAHAKSRTSSVGERAKVFRSHGALSAFTLIELLVVIAVIGLIIGIALPILGRAKDKAKDLVCLSNHRQFGIAFGAYAADYDQLPIADYVSPHVNRLAWGGVNWYTEDADVPLYMLKSRPMNPYLGLTREHDGGFEAFRCPRDDGMRHTASDAQVNWWDDYGFQSFSADWDQTVYGIMGTSYTANDWMWVHPQSEDGFGPYPWPYYKRDMGPDDVIVGASRFILVTDHGADHAGRFTREQRVSSNFAYGWWHGYEIGNMTFLDGSARREEMGTMITDTYCFWSNPDVQWRGGQRP